MTVVSAGDLDRARARLQSASPDADELLEAADVAKMLHMSTDYVYAEVRANRLPHIRFGRKVRFRRASIEAWLVARETGSSN